MARLPAGRDVTLALALPAGLGLMPFHQALLGHLSIHPITTLERMAADAGAAEREARDGGVDAARVSWSHDGVPRSCFNRVSTGWAALPCAGRALAIANSGALDRWVAQRILSCRAILLLSLRLRVRQRIYPWVCFVFNSKPWSGSRTS